MKTEATNKTRLEKMKEFYKTLKSEIDLCEFADEDHENFNDLQSAIDDGSGFDIEILYYGSAMEYLTNNDPSLRESLELASGMGFDLKNLNSETLASLLASENSRSEFAELESEIEAFFEELNAERDAEEAAAEEEEETE